mgnify:CR=1
MDNILNWIEKFQPFSNSHQNSNDPIASGALNKKMLKCRLFGSVLFAPDFAAEAKQDSVNVGIWQIGGF